VNIICVITIRIDDELIKELEAIKERYKFKSLSEVVRKAIKEFVLSRTLPWSSREEVYRYFREKRKAVQGV